MSTIPIPNLRHTSLSAAGTIIVPANETWIIKSANAQMRHSRGNTVESMTITATIDSNSGVVWYDKVEIDRTFGGAPYMGMTGIGGPIFGSTMTLKTGDTLVLTKVGSPSITKLEIYYYIFESDF